MLEKYAKLLCHYSINAQKNQTVLVSSAGGSVGSLVCQIAKLRRTDRRVAKNPENIFFKTKKLQLKQLTDKINISMRTFRADDTHMKAGTFKDKEKR